MLQESGGFIYAKTTNKSAFPVQSGDKKKCCILLGSRKDIYCKAGERPIPEFVFLLRLAAALQLLIAEHVPRRCAVLGSPRCRGQAELRQTPQRRYS